MGADLFTVAVTFMILGVILSIAGLAMVVSSLVSASRRGQAVGSRFWAPAEMFEARELALNRRGFWICLAGIACLFLTLYLLLA